MKFRISKSRIEAMSNNNASNSEYCGMCNKKSILGCSQCWTPICDDHKGNPDWLLSVSPCGHHVFCTKCVKKELKSKIAEVTSVCYQCKKRCSKCTYYHETCVECGKECECDNFNVINTWGSIVICESCIESHEKINLQSCIRSDLFWEETFEYQIQYPSDKNEKKCMSMGQMRWLDWKIEQQEVTDIFVIYYPAHSGYQLDIILEYNIWGNKDYKKEMDNKYRIDACKLLTKTIDELVTMGQISDIRKCSKLIPNVFYAPAGNYFKTITRFIGQAGNSRARNLTNECMRDGKLDWIIPTGKDLTFRDKCFFFPIVSTFL